MCFCFLASSTSIPPKPSSTSSGQLVQPGFLSPAGKYCYGAHLKQLAACKPQCRGTPPELLPIITPLKWDTWASALQSHPDQDFVTNIIEGLRFGFGIGFNYASHACTPAKCNMLSTSQHPEVIDEYLKRSACLVV